MEAQEAKARAQKAEALAKLRLEEARNETEQKLLDCSEKGSSVTVARKSRVLSRRISDCTKNDVTVPKQIACNLGNQNWCLCSLYLIKILRSIITSNDKEEMNTSI